MRKLVQDVRYALRSLGRAPAFACVAILTLALGIGANTAMFSLVHAVILKPLPFRDPSRLIAAWDTYLPQFPKIGVSPAELDLWQQQADLFAQTGWYRYVSLDLDLTAPGAEALEVHATFISPSLLPMLGVAPLRGRAFADHENPNVALISYRLWQTRFGGDQNLVGKTVRLNEQEFAVAGIMPQTFKFPDFADVWLPPGPLLGDQITNPVRHALGFVARLRPGVSQQQARVRLDELSRSLAAEHPKTSTGFGMRVYGLQEDLTANIRPALLMLLGAVALVLLIACGNVANLLLARASGRAREMAVRIALGAGAFRIVRQLLTESLVLAALGGALGLAIGQWGLSSLGSGLAPVEAPLDSAVLLFLFAVSMATGIVFGLTPAVQALDYSPNSVIKSGAIPGGASSRVRGVLVVAEFALALVLVAGAGILMKSFVRLMRVDPGFDPRGLLTLRISFPPSRQPNDLFHRIEERVLPMPGVDSVAAANTLPLLASRANTSRFSVPGSPLINPDALPAAQLRFVSPDYFRTMRIPIRSGRAFTERDLNDLVVIINETMAKRFWPGRDAVGQKYIFGVWGPTPTWATIIGVAGDVKQFGLDSEASLDEYLPSLAPTYLIVHTAGDPRSIANAVRGAIHSIDPALPVSDVRTMQDVAAESASTRRWTMGLLAAFAGLALALALIGIYGLISWSVAQRTREIGVRMALGAQADQVVAMVMRYGLKLSVLGLLIGLAGAFAVRRFLASLALDVSTADPMIYGGVIVLMLGVAMLGCYVPARRASRVDPLIALRWE
jgi:putative ABC transport system permease protein